MADINQVQFWQNRYDNAQTGWDLGVVSPPMRAYFHHILSHVNKDIRILIAGAGNAHEAIFLHELGFSQVYVVDFVSSVLDNFAKANPTFNPQHLLCHDFFEMHKFDVGQFDLVVEQAFLCAIDPTRRDEYARQMHRLLKDGGQLVGVLFDCEFVNSPPFGGSLAEYCALFEPYFDTDIMAGCYNSVKPRAGRELFIRLIKV